MTLDASRNGIGVAAVVYVVVVVMVVLVLSVAVAAAAAATAAGCDELLAVGAAVRWSYLVARTHVGEVSSLVRTEGLRATVSTGVHHSVIIITLVLEARPLRVGKHRVKRHTPHALRAVFAVP